MGSNSRVNRMDRQIADQQLIDGLKKHTATLPSLTFGGTSHPTAAIIPVLEARLASAAAVPSAKASWRETVKADREELAKTAPFVSGLRQAIELALAGSIDALADFGLKPRKANAPRTPVQKAASVAKAKATRAARHTMGTKQRAKIKAPATETTPAGLPAPAQVIAPSAPAATPKP